MAKQFRDVSGGSQVWGSMIPGYNFASYLLGIVSVPIETFLRRDFGERYYSKANFIAGFVVLFSFRFLIYILDLINPSNWFRTGENEPRSWLSAVVFWYVVIGIIHFITIWVRDVTRTYRYSYDSGRSWLLIVGRSIIWIMNLIAGIIVRIIASFLPEKYKQRLLNTLPLFRDVTAFTERFIEPAFVLYLAMYAGGHGQPATAMWLAISFGALNLSTGRRHQQERAYVLDYRDQVIEARALQALSEGREAKQIPHLQRTFNETMNEIEKSPEVLETIKEEQPAVARAIAAVRARQKKAQFGSDSIDTSQEPYIPSN